MMVQLRKFVSIKESEARVIELESQRTVPVYGNGTIQRVCLSWGFRESGIQRVKELRNQKVKKSGSQRVRLSSRLQRYLGVVSL